MHSKRWQWPLVTDRIRLKSGLGKTGAFNKWVTFFCLKKGSDLMLETYRKANTIMIDPGTNGLKF